MVSEGGQRPHRHQWGTGRPADGQEVGPARPTCAGVPSDEPREPLPASRGRCPVASPRHVRHWASAGPTVERGGLEVVAAVRRPRPQAHRTGAPGARPRRGRRRRCRPTPAAAGARSCAPRTGSGSTLSPIPSTRARPPRTQNGTSAPRRAANVGVGAPRPSAARRRRRPSRRRGPRPVGIALRDPDRRPSAHRAESAGHEVVGAGRHPWTRRAPPRTSSTIGDPAPGSNVERVGEVDRHHLGVEQVEPVGTHPGDAQRQRELGRCRDATSTPSGEPASAGPLASPTTGHSLPVTHYRSPPRVHAASLPHSSTLRFSARRAGVDAGGVERRRRGPRPPVTGAASCGGARSRPAPARTARRPPTTSGSTATLRGAARCAPATDSTAGRGTNTDAGTWPTTRAVA